MYQLLCSIANTYILQNRPNSPQNRIGNNTMKSLLLLLTLSCFDWRREISAFPVNDADLIDLSRYEAADLFKPSLETGRLVSEWNADWNVNPEELGEYLEGDILFSGRTKNGLVALSARWKDAVVPYVIKGPYSEEDLRAIFNAMDEYHTKTCIRYFCSKKDI